MRSAIALFALAIAALGGCGGYRSSYRRAHPGARELVWTYHNKLQVTRDGQIVAEQRDWDALSGAVACVPRARAWAATAASRDRTGSVLSWTGIATMVGGVVAGSALLFSDTSNTDQVLLGGGVMIGGLIAGTPLLLGGMTTRVRADASAIDAVNLYNDERASCTAAAALR